MNAFPQHRGARDGARPARITTAAALSIALVTVACGGDPLNLGSDPDFAWWSDHETANVSDWLRGGETMGTSYLLGGGSLAVEVRSARSGQHVLVSQVPAGRAAAQVSRRGALSGAGYYGAWFYVPRFARPAAYWVFFALRESPGTALWDLKLTPGAGDTLTLQLFDHRSGDKTPLLLRTVPIGSWFQVQAYFRAVGDADDALRIWQDDALVYDLKGAEVHGAPNLTPVWMLGTNTDGLTPEPTVLRIDDAFVSTRRIRPEAPPFWRANAAR